MVDSIRIDPDEIDDQITGNGTLQRFTDICG